jgi:hypothetical protein
LAYTVVEISEGSTGFGSANMPLTGGTVNVSYASTKSPTPSELTLTVTPYLCSVVNGGTCVAGLSTPTKFYVSAAPLTGVSIAPVGGATQATVPKSPITVRP